MKKAFSIDPRSKKKSDRIHFSDSLSLKKNIFEWSRFYPPGNYFVKEKEEKEKKEKEEKRKLFGFVSVVMGEVPRSYGGRGDGNSAIYVCFFCFFFRFFLVFILLSSFFFLLSSFFFLLSFSSFFLVSRDGVDAWEYGEWRETTSSIYS